MLGEIVAIYAIVEDLLKAIGHQEDCRIQMSDAEVITAALVAARFFQGNQFVACQHLDWVCAGNPRTPLGQNQIFDDWYNSNRGWYCASVSSLPAVTSVTLIHKL